MQLEGNNKVIKLYFYVSLTVISNKPKSKITILKAIKPHILRLNPYFDNINIQEINRVIKPYKIINKFQTSFTLPTSH
jgi:hypothetical protein